MANVTITKEEQKAIRSLERLAKKWPSSISLFSWSGTLCVWKDINGRNFHITTVKGINNDGGDPCEEEVDQFATIDYE